MFVEAKVKDVRKVVVVEIERVVFSTRLHPTVVNTPCQKCLQDIFKLIIYSY